jgi:mannose-6-phosphate isomerase-like protein (cupin superfamily)
MVITARRSIDPGDGRLIETKNYLHRYLNPELADKRFVPLIVELRARTLAEFGALLRHPGEEFTLVLAGVVVVHTECYTPVRLEVGQSIYMDSSMGHAYLAGSDAPCRVVSVSTAPQAHFGTAVTTEAERAGGAGPGTPTTAKRRDRAPARARKQTVGKR